MLVLSLAFAARWLWREVQRYTTRVDPRPVFILVDNGSKRWTSVRSLRAIASAVKRTVDSAADDCVTVVPSSIGWSNQVCPVLLRGQPAEVVEETVRRHVYQGRRNFVIVPVFLGPSGQITRRLPTLLKKLQGALPYPPIRVEYQDPLVVIPRPGAGVGGLHRDEAKIRATQDVSAENPVVAALCEAVLAKLSDLGLDSAPVVLVDHGSPSRGVTAVRNYVGQRLEAALGPASQGVFASSMERRADPAYDFNEPLLERVFDQNLVLQRGDVVVALMFLSPGRHAGPGGDIAQILHEVSLKHTGMRPHMTSLLGTTPQVTGVLAARVLDSLAAQRWGGDT